MRLRACCFTASSSGREAAGAASILVAGVGMRDTWRSPRSRVVFVGGDHSIWFHDSRLDVSIGIDPLILWKSLAMDCLSPCPYSSRLLKAGSLSAAGRTLRMPLPTVSREVSELESHIKARLLNRSTRQLTLTEAGRAYLAACKRILEDAPGEAERSASGENSAPRGELIITAPVVFGRRHVVPTVAEFLKAYPEVDARLVLSDRSLNLLEDHVDLAGAQLPWWHSSLVATRVGTVRNVVCASPAYLAQHGTPRNPTELVKHDCLTFSGLMSPDSWTFTINGAAASVPVHSRLIVNTAEAAIDAAIAGAGFTLARPLISDQGSDQRRCACDRTQEIRTCFNPNQSHVHRPAVVAPETACVPGFRDAAIREPGSRGPRLLLRAQSECSATSDSRRRMRILAA